MNQKPPRDPRRDGNDQPAPERLSVPRLGRLVAPPPAVPPPVHRARPGGTMVGLPAPPARASAPMPERKPTLRDLPPETRSLTPPEMPALSTLKGIGGPGSEPQPSVPIPWNEARTRPGRPESTPLPSGQPGRSLSPPPGSGEVAVDVQVGGQRVKLRAGAGARKLLPWLAPVVLSVLTSIGGAIVGYYEGLAAAGRRVATIEEQQRMLGEQQAKMFVRVESLENGAAAESQANRAERATRDRQIEDIRGRLPKIEGLPPTPSNSPK